MFSTKLHKSYRDVVAICDLNLLGKKFEEGKKQLDVRENFFKDKEMDKKELIIFLQFQKKEDATFNIVGPNSISAAQEAEVISKENTGYVDGVPFALILA